MKLGTIAYNNQIYNLDYMTAEELKELTAKIEIDKKRHISELKNIDFVRNDISKK